MAERSDSTYDVFISYARADAGEWTQVLAENLERLGFRVFWDAWEIGAGDVLVHELDRGILNSRTGVLVASREAMKRPWVQMEYAALLSRSVDGRQRLIPLMLHDVELPPLLATHVWVDFRQAERYDEAIHELARRLREETHARSKLGEPLQMPPGTGLKAVGPIRCRLVISKREVILRGGEAEARGPAGQLDIALDNDLWQLGRLRKAAFQNAPHRAGATAAGAAQESPLHGHLLEVGRELSSRFLPPAVAAELSEALKEASRLGSSLELGIEVVEPILRGLPWETLRLPGADGTFGEPLILHPRVQMYRVVTGDGAAPVVQISGPLRVLVAIGSPDAQQHRPELLNYEEELARIVESLDPARRKGQVYVKILYRGTVAEIRKALAAEQYHVLYVSCHAGPGVLILEDEEGEEDEVSAERLWSEAFPANRQPPVVVLAGCATALGRVEEKKAKEGETVSEARPLPGLAEDLLHHGVPVVVAMQASVGDEYARMLGASFFEALATFEDPDPLPALAEARRRVEQQRLKGEGKTDLAEWATPALWTLAVGGAIGRAALPLYDPEAPFTKTEEPLKPVFAEGVVSLKAGDFVGRRREERLGLKVLRGNEKSGVLLHGLGGIGKSTLAVELLRRLEEGSLVVSVVGQTAPGSILAEIGEYLLAAVPQDQPLRDLAVELGRPDLDWEVRLKRYRLKASHLPVILFLDNFEDNLRPVGSSEYEISNEQLADFLSRWLCNTGQQSRTIVTSRHPFPLPAKAERRLEALHLGPLSWPETRKLIWRLPALDKLTPDEQYRAYVDVGGHPRALKYLEALLVGGETRFQDIQERMEKTLLEREGLAEPTGWLGGVAGDLNKALAATVTVASGDVLLSELLKRLENEPLALRLLVGASVYRLPVNRWGLLWQVGVDLGRSASVRLEELQADVEQRRLTSEPIEEFVGSAVPPLEEPEGLDHAIEALCRLGLLSEIACEQVKQTRYVVHRWTAVALERLRPTDEFRKAHWWAAQSWFWEVERGYSDRVPYQLEVRHHLYRGGEIDKAFKVTQEIIIELERRGDYRIEEQLLKETLDWLPEISTRAAACLHHLGVIAQRRGSYDEATDYYSQALARFEALGDRARLSGIYHQLGNVAFCRSEYGRAIEWYQKALAISEELDDRGRMACSYHQLGQVAQWQGFISEARRYSQRALSLFSELEELEGVANSYQLLGSLAQSTSSYSEAYGWYQKSLALFEQLNNRTGTAKLRHAMGVLAEAKGNCNEALIWLRGSLLMSEQTGDLATMAACYQHLGQVAERQGSYAEARAWYHKAVEINETLGNRGGLASAYQQLGVIATLGGSHAAALDWYHKSLRIREELGDRAGLATLYHQLGLAAESQFRHSEALAWYLKSLSVAEDLGNLQVMAATYGQLGVLVTSQEKPEDGVAWTLKSIGLHLQLGSGDVAKDLGCLQHQRNLLGPGRFEQILEEHMDSKSKETVLTLLQQYEEAQNQPAPQPEPDTP